MRIIRRQAHARAALVGNPSDGYGGKTIAVSVGNFAACVTCYEWDEIELVQNQQDKVRFDSLDDLVRDVELHGYYGGVRLVKATIKKFAEFCRREKFPLRPENFAIRYETNIPRQVGLAGSSAIVVATLRALLAFHELTVPPEVLPSHALSVENDELGISAGLQDRVIQFYGGLVYMDFAPHRQQSQCGLSHGRYESLPCSRLPPLYLAYSNAMSKSSGAVHSPLRQSYLTGDPKVRAGMVRLAELTEEARGAILGEKWDRLGSLINETFATRQSMYEPDKNLVAMVTLAQNLGASANFAGSGGAIIGIHRDEAMYEDLRREFDKIDCRVVKPLVVENLDVPLVAQG
ncbi:MAG: GHMP kinase [Planctomycetes bacterium]|nr:GHMP kinase [Planctomycetota bacterium]